jgi:hypothetical protein
MKKIPAILALLAAAATVALADPMMLLSVMDPPSAPSAVWNPSAHGLVQRWHTAKLNAQTAGQWNDQSANAFHAFQPSNANRAVYSADVGGYPALVFDGADDHFTNAPLSTAFSTNAFFSVVLTRTAGTISHGWGRNSTAGYNMLWLANNILYNSLLPFGTLNVGATTNAGRLVYAVHITQETNMVVYLNSQPIQTNTTGAGAAADMIWIGRRSTTYNASPLHEMLALANVTNAVAVLNAQKQEWGIE